MFTIFIFFILKDFLYRYFLACSPIQTEINHTKCSLPCHSFDFIFTRWCLKSLGMCTVHSCFGWLVSFCLKMFVWNKRFIFCNSNKPFRFIATFKHILGINVNIFRFSDNPFCFFKLFLKLCMLWHFFNLCDHPPMHFFIRIPSLLIWRRFIYKHMIIYYYIEWIKKEMEYADIIFIKRVKVGSFDLAVSDMSGVGLIETIWFERTSLWLKY